MHEGDAVDLYLDCEWADVLASELVSIALVSADEQHSFYAERDPLPTDPVPWVRSVVYPLLERGDAALDDNTLTHRLRDFLAGLSNPRIHYDSGHDRALCQYVIDGLDAPEPEGPTPTVSWVRLDGLHSELERWWQTHPEQQPRRHHALVDAMALRGAALRGC
jgi:hypothetical protein